MSGYKTRSAKPFLATPYENPERQFRAKRNNTPISIHNLFSFCDHSDSDTKLNEGTSIDTLTMEEYMGRTNYNFTRRVNSEPEAVKFEIKGHIIQEVQNKQFSGENDEEDAQEHVEEILYIVSTYGSPNVSTYKLMPKVFPLSLTGQARRWFNRLPLESKATWENLRKAFVEKFCPPTKLAASLREIYRGLDDYTRNILDSQKPIPGLTPEKAFDAIQRTAEHCHKWHLETGFGPRDNFKHKVMKTLAKNDGGYAADFERARRERNEAERNQ
ncbi:hypothetical protein CTI12_AA123840 [Artemisia annua]|uniref:Retrotransposon gag domain-containing protein n=1 Tax=Artemisia annua TaxID=35608 RepID=A0A2U1PQE7_ARTAN|nr:hypothetical protein CTI12_AA123840 [Artemisia annua]